jgi:hypothetical protein
MAQNDTLKDNVECWRTKAEFVAVRGHHMAQEDGQEVDASDISGSEDHRDILDQIYTPGCGSLNQAGMTERQAERLPKDRAGGAAADSGLRCQENWVGNVQSWRDGSTSLFSHGSTMDIPSL